MPVSMRRMLIEYLLAIAATGTILIVLATVFG